MKKSYIISAVLLAALAAANVLAQDKNAAQASFNKQVNDARAAITKGNYAEADSALAQLAADASLSAADRARVKTVLADSYQRQKKTNEAIKIQREIATDASLTLADRMKAFDAIVETQRRGGSLDQAVATGTEMLALPLDADQKAVVSLRNASIYAAMKPPKRAEADAILKAVLNDGAFALKHRVNAFVPLAQAIIDGKDKAAKKSIPELAKGILADPAITGNDFYRVQEQIIKAARDVGDDEALIAAANAVRANTNASNAQKIAATWAIVANYMDNDKIAEAAKLVREPLSYQNLGTDDTVTAYANIGRALEWQEKCDEAIATYREILTKFDSPNVRSRVNQLTADALISFNRHEDAAKVYRDAGQPMDEAKVYGRSLTPEKAKPIALKVLEDETQPEGLRRQAYEYFVGPRPADRKIAEKYLSFYMKDFGPGANAGVFAAQVRSAMMFGNYEYAVYCSDIARKMPAYTDDFLSVLYHVNALAGVGKTADAAKLAGDYATQAKFSPEQRYQMALTAAVLQAPEQAGASAKAIAAVDAASPDAKQIDNKKRSDLMLKVGRTAMIGNKAVAAKEIYAAYEKLFIPQPKKLYKVGFSEAPVSGLTSWERLAIQPAPQTMDRQFGGDMDFLVTDVATGNRGAGIGSENAAKQLKYTEFAALCDVNGIHFVFTGYDERAREVEAKLAGAGSYEGYIAPGPNQPYTCFLVDLQSGKVDFWHSTYNNEQHRRIEEAPPALRSEHVFSDNGYKTYMFLSWESFYDKLPDANDLWDFENVHWGRSGGYSWNGTKSIHGRSTWGNLQFSIPKKAMTDIKRKLVFSALAKYKAEKSTGGRHQGVIDFWKDDAIGDVQFYNAVVAPYVKTLDAYIPLVKAGMSDADVETVFKEAVPGWNEIVFKVAEMRRQYLETKLGE